MPALDRAVESASSGRQLSAALRPFLQRAAWHHRGSELLAGFREAARSAFPPPRSARQALDAASRTHEAPSARQERGARAGRHGVSRGERSGGCAARTHPSRRGLVTFSKSDTAVQDGRGTGALRSLGNEPFARQHPSEDEKSSPAGGAGTITAREGARADTPGPPRPRSRRPLPTGAGVERTLASSGTEKPSALCGARR